MKRTLAILGGSPVRTRPYAPNITTGLEERSAVLRVLDSGRLSLFEGSAKPTAPYSFCGGPEIQALEREWGAYYHAKHAITVNSATSGLYVAIGAAGCGAGDEVIVSPYTMSASAACALVYNALPVFADVEPDTFCLDPRSIEKCVTPRTKAVMVVHLAGQPADMDPIMEIARRHDLIVIEDCAQSHGITYKGRPVGTLGQIGVFSLNSNKTIQTGEGGVITTNHDEFALKMQLIRNHAETVVAGLGRNTRAQLVNMLGFNYRLNEIEAAIAREQLKKLSNFNSVRQEIAGYLTEKLKGFPGIIPPIVREGCTHGYYLYMIRYLAERAGLPRSLFGAALRAEGIPFLEGYVRPLYLQPMYQEQILYGETGCPFKCPFYKGHVDYSPGRCPVVENLYHDEMLVSEDIMRSNLTCGDMDDVVAAFEKIYLNIRELRDRAEGGTLQVEGKMWKAAVLPKTIA